MIKPQPENLWVGSVYLINKLQEEILSRSKQNLNLVIRNEIKPRSRNQSIYMESLQNNIFTFGVGHAGAGKSLISIWQAVLELFNPKNRIKKIIIIRPCIDNKFGEDIGSLPGDIREKMLPHCLAVTDCLSMFLDQEVINKLLYDGTIEFIPLTLLRGRSFNNAFVIVEEAQNIKKSGKGIYMVMSRLGVHSKMAFNGDLKQSDLVDGESALLEAIQLLKDPPQIKGIGIVELYDKADIQRHPLLYEIMIKFNQVDNNPFN